MFFLNIIRTQAHAQMYAHMPTYRPRQSTHIHACTHTKAHISHTLRTHSQKKIDTNTDTDSDTDIDIDAHTRCI